MTPRQHDVLEFVRAYIAREGWSPTIREIAKGIGLSSPQPVHRHLRALEREGLIERGLGPRQIRLVRGKESDQE